MPENLENEFVDLVRKRNQKKKKLLVQRIIVVLLVAIASSVLGYWLFNPNISFNIGNFIVNPTLLGLVGIILTIGLLIYIIKNISFHKKDDTSLSKSINLKRIKGKYLVGYLLLILALIFQANPSIIDNHLNGLIPRLIYNPQPPTSNSPWPWQNQKTIHPVVAGMTSDMEKSIKSVAEYIDKHEPNPYLKIKALHDYVISRVTYDLDVLKTGIRPSQDAKTVFITHKGVCEGYANLFKALGQAIGIDVVYILGKIRQDLAPVDVIPENIRILKSNYDWTDHAWNAVKVQGDWQLVDTTWDDTNSDNYATYSSGNYLMLPPQAMIMSHFPQQSDWQLLQEPVNYTYFEQQPILTPHFFAENLTIVSPTEYRTNVQKTALIEIETPPNYRNKIVAIFSRSKEEKESGFSLWSLPLRKTSTQDKIPDVEQCQSQDNGGGITKISCQLPKPGDYEVNMFSIEEKNNPLRKESIPIGQIRFHYGQ